MEAQTTVEVQNFAVRERQFVRQAKKQEKKRINYDRFRAIISITLLGIIACSAICVGFAGKSAATESGYRSKAKVGFYMSNILRALGREITYSVSYVVNTSSSIPDRVFSDELAAYQVATQDAIAAASSASYGCSLCTRILSMIDMQHLLFVQTRVKRRTFNPMECLRAYQSIFETIIETLSFFVGYALPSGAENLLWLQELVSATQAVGMLAPATMDGNLYTNALAQEMYSGVSSSVSLLNSVNRNSFMLNISYQDELLAYQKSVEGVMMKTIEVFEQIDVDLSGITVVNGEYSPEEALQEIDAIYGSLLEEFTNERNEGNRFIALSTVTVTTNVIVVVLALLTIGILLYAALSIIWVSSEYRYNLRHEERFKSSLERMEFFVDRVYDLDMEGVTLAAQKSAESKSITSAERDLLRLAPKLIQVLAFINPNVYSFRKKFMKEDKKTINVFFSEDKKPIEGDGSGETHPRYQEGAAVPVRIDINEQDHSGPSQPTPNPLAVPGVTAPPAPAPAAAVAHKRVPPTIKAEAGGIQITGLTETKLVAQSVCFLLVDISTFYDEVTSETSKTRPLEISNVLSQLIQCVKNGGGEYIATVGSIVVTAFNEADVPDAENTSVMVLLSIEQKLLGNYPNIRFAVIAGTVPQGIVGYPSLMSYITDGSILYTGEMLLQVARLHDATAVVDTTTFMKIDTQYFSKRALEQVGIDETDIEGITTVYEIVPQTNDKGSFMWNEAFDQFHAGEFAEAKENLEAWRQKYGVTKSWERMMSLLNAYPRPRTVMYLYCTGNNLEPELFLA